ncbi:hypothetical protein EJ08DRAFT_456179 [Tothia fuscella]|uniref:Uncharacterized protein n=1 Tax=Tothia fuscella TaxID=1048955 RepID=A0A9P4TUZ9_9PEZI|nr:hypothetical protein EJ08DRAFT_456179 [Tothia fuscella]
MIQIAGKALSSVSIRSFASKTYLLKRNTASQGIPPHLCQIHGHQPTSLATPPSKMPFLHWIFHHHKNDTPPDILIQSTHAPKMAGFQPQSTEHLLQEICPPL